MAAHSPRSAPMVFVRLGLIPLLAVVVQSVLPPGYEDEAWCPAGSCLREVSQPPHIAGPVSASKECHDMVTHENSDEVWTGLRAPGPAPPGYVKVLSHTDESFQTITCPVGGGHGLPPLPSQYEVWVTCNIVNKNYTTVVHEIYDKPNERLMLSRYLHGATTTHLYLYGEDAWYRYNETSCASGSISSMEHRGPPGGADGHMIGTAEFLRFGQAGQQELWMGIVNVAGVPCDHYRSEVNGPNGTSHQVLDYYFSTGGWSVPEAHASRVPVLLNLSGWYMRGPGQQHHYHHYYEFGHFTVGPNRLGNAAFMVPRTAGACSGASADKDTPYAPEAIGSCNGDGSSGRGEGGGMENAAVVGLCFLMLFIGGAIVALFHRCMGGKRSGPKPVIRMIETSNPTVNVSSANSNVA
eukprot:CAMPEP_0174702172 /NCGR_PEP_ID=MMETSP1094-20130205/6544_1 /TAXON_ID=156173 /ORGANISM="Chrysochromulina brevifilum, Strain UTEX LB 985" /LENGTH=408 /DNA_ID=CAMNT_0015899913 /DNA_START=29 /DNA_END=1255 /DNA_ORIENTATION=-